MSSLNSLFENQRFVQRHNGSSLEQQAQMLNSLSMDSLEEMLDKIVPSSIRRTDEMTIGKGLSEQDALAKLKKIAQQNKTIKSFIGMGYYNTFTPPVVQRNVLENPAWYTAYTPYQAEISQGRMEAMLNYQTMISDLTGMELANASLLDEATACAEAMTLCQRMSKSKGKVFFVDENCHPQNIELVQNRAKPIGIEVVVGNPIETNLESLEIFGVLLQYPGSNGEVSDFSQLAEVAHSKKALVAVATDLLALTLLTPPGDFGADVAVGNSQRFGVPLGYGGPHAAFMATKDAFKRSMPGRLIGMSIDSQGNPALRLALQTREQHIRREKATSNICTAQALLAVMASMYALYHGEDGLKSIANRVTQLTHLFKKALEVNNINIVNSNVFDTLSIKVINADTILNKAVSQGYNLRKIDNNTVSVAFDETTVVADVVSLWSVFDIENIDVDELYKSVETTVPASMKRTGKLFSNDVFERYHSETEMMRYMRYLADKDLALDRAMIPLGSCTMKLNAAAELQPVSWAEFSQIHPFVPLNQVNGYQQMIDELEEMLCQATGYDAVSLQPNSGAQGEYAGLLAIHAYHESRGEGHRNICLIPASAHGTNPASAQMAGLKVVVVKTNEQGEVDIDDLTSKCEKHAENVSAIMITYPSTHGVFEENVTEVCELVHKFGGQVYIDGANMNAMVAVASPGKFGGDVSHLNLHKTFAIPHGGGGPGIGPIGVKQHLAEFLPRTPKTDSKVGLVSGAPWGSAGVLPISWMYIAMMGAKGLYQATANAILNANYTAQKLAPHYPILYTDKNGMVAHECIIDLRPIKETTGITVDDVAKRLIDYGFHAPTMSFPVAGTLMIEPTESESKAEIDRFCDAMIAIKKEIEQVENDELAEADSPLRNAPHTAYMVTGDKWKFAYSREIAAFPVESLKHNKYWAPVSRVDNVYGDKNLVCSCPSIESYEGEVK
jgi:glycine dehydrogenase